MPDAISIFTDRLYNEWLPAFCEAKHRNYSTAGFKEESIKKLSEYDAHWFLMAVDLSIVSESDGFFMAPKSKAKEQIFWTGEKKKIPLLITLWAEPIITIGALARLNQEFGWPIDCLGAQSKTWAFDLVCYEKNSEEERIVCEVKKDKKEIEHLVIFMKRHCANPPQSEEPANSRERNAYRKVQGVRRTWPKVFWALGPEGKGHVFYVERDGLSQSFSLNPASEEALKFAKASRLS